VNGAAEDESGKQDLAIWQRDEAFPPAGEGFGWMDRKGGRHSCASLEDLSKTIREDLKSVVDLVWTPESEFCRVPEEIEAFTEPIQEVRKRWAVDDLADAQNRLKWFGIGVAVLLGYMAFQGWAQLGALERANGVSLDVGQRVLWISKLLAQSTTVGMSLLGFLIFAFIPWYQAQKRMREIRRRGGQAVPVIPLIRFETWLGLQKAPVTRVLFGLIVVVALVQMFLDKSIIVFHGSVQHAGLVKPAYFGGEWWRLFTAPMLHGGIVHLAMNMLALLYLGKRVEVFARWPHVAMVFLFSALVGGEASARFMDAPSVGASGGLMGWLGFLLVFETLHSKLVPKSAGRRLIGGVVMTGLIGLVGYRFIDNAAHFGGLLAGIAYAVIVFPNSGSVTRPRMNATDRVAGAASLAVIALSGAYAIMKMAA